MSDPGLIDPNQITADTSALDTQPSTAAQTQPQSSTPLSYNDWISSGRPSGDQAPDVSPQAPSIPSDPSNPDYSNSGLGAIMQWENQHIPNEGLGAAIHSATESIVPTIAGFGSAVAGQGIARGVTNLVGGAARALAAPAAEAAAGAVEGGEVGAVAGLGVADEATIPIGSIIGALTALGAGFIGSQTAVKGQTAVTNNLFSQQDIKAYTQQRKKETTDAPVQSALGDLAPSVVGFNPSNQEPPFCL